MLSGACPCDPLSLTHPSKGPVFKHSHAGGQNLTIVDLGNTGVHPHGDPSWVWRTAHFLTSRVSREVEKHLNLFPLINKMTPQAGLDLSVTRAEQAREGLGQGGGLKD